MAGTIYLGFLNGYWPHWAEQVGPPVEEAFGRRVESLRIDLDLDTYFAPERQQYHATLILARLLRDLPEGGSHIVGVASVDLYIPVLTFVFGQSQLGGPGAVMSTYRLHNEYYGLPSDEGLLFDRTVKEVVHELGHAFGLVHCPDYQCVMSASTYVEDVDLKQADLCQDCRGQLLEPQEGEAAAG